jgi:hypothetical protein
MGQRSALGIVLTPHSVKQLASGHVTKSFGSPDFSLSLKSAFSAIAPHRPPRKAHIHSSYPLHTEFDEKKI